MFVTTIVFISVNPAVNAFYNIATVGVGSTSYSTQGLISLATIRLFWDTWPVWMVFGVAILILARSLRKSSDEYEEI